MKKAMAFLLSVVLLFTAVSAITVMAGPDKGMIASDSLAQEYKYGLKGATGFNERSFPIINRLTSGSNNNWWDASVSGNGEIAFMENGSPDEDVFIFNNTKLVHDSGVITETPNVSTWADEIKASAMDSNGSQSRNTTWSARRDEYARNTYGTGVNYSNYWPRPYQPAAQYRIKNNDYTAFNGVGSNRGSSGNLYGGYILNDNYNRYTNFETAEVGVQWRDDAGNEWNRRSFPSREDEVIVTYIEGPEGKDLDITLSIDLYREMSGASGSTSNVSTDNVLSLDENNRPIGYGMIGKYNYGMRDGTLERRERLFAYGGWATATRIVTDGQIAYTNNDRAFGSGSSATTHKDPRITVTGTKSIMLITKIDRINTGCNNLADVKDKLYDQLLGQIEGVVNKYSVKNDNASYDKLLAPHAKIHGDIYNTVKADFTTTDETEAQNTLSNIELIRIQNGYRKTGSIPDEMNLALLERVFNAGRFGLLCSSGYQSARLGGIWNGQWNPQWSGDFTLNANTNIQISAMNTGNLTEGANGYTNLIVRMVADWEINATHAYGMENAILAPPRVDGTGEGGSYHASSPTWPHMYVNALGDWLIAPMFEYYQTHGNRPIKVGKDINLTKPTNTKDRVFEKTHTIASVLMLSEADVARIEASGEMNLEKDILYPMVLKNMNFWTQLADERFYMGSDGTAHVNDGTTLSEALLTDPGAKYAITPGFSPENTPSGWGGSLAYNNAVDIAAIHNSLSMARYIVGKVNPANKADLLAKWAAFEKLVPAQMKTEGGAIKEWATPYLRENNGHRHLSHGYDAFPGFRAQENLDLRSSIAQALDDRSAAYNGVYAPESHDGVHRILIESRLKRGERVERAMKWLIGTGYTNASMTTGHNSNRGSSFCTDSAHGDVGGIVESLIYSDIDEIEILPALMPTMKTGKIQGLRARNNSLINNLEWNKKALTASVTVTTDEANNNLKLMCGVPWKKVSISGVEQEVKTDELGRPYIGLALKKGVSVKVDFVLEKTTISISTDEDLSQKIAEGATVQFDAAITPPAAAEMGAKWTAVDAATGNAVQGVSISSDGLLTIAKASDSAGKWIKVSAASNDGMAESNEMMVKVSPIQAPVRKIENENLACGFGYYVIETNKSSASNRAELGYVGGANGRVCVLKYSDVDFTNLESVNLIRTYDGAANVTLYADLPEAENKTYFSYTDNVSTPQASRRYQLADVTLVDENAVSATELIANSNRNYTLDLNKTLEGTHDLYIKIQVASGTYGGNYDYMLLNYALPDDVVDDEPLNAGTILHDNGDLTVYLSNDNTGKNVRVIWAAYDEAGKLIRISSKEHALEAKKISSLVLSPAWDVTPHRTEVFVWDKTTLVPYMKQLMLG